MKLKIEVAVLFYFITRIQAVYGERSHLHIGYPTPEPISAPASRGRKLRENLKENSVFHVGGASQ